ncbi:MAG: 1-deoxy-D-xylulose-5-phosphate synthase [Candidatus Brocadiia bacterium]
MVTKSQIMYIEYKGGGLAGPARIGRVTFSKSGKSVYYKNKYFEPLKGAGFKANFFDKETGDEYWISGCHKDGQDALYSTTVVIDEDARKEYWLQIREQPENIKVSKLKLKGKYNR